VPENENCVPCAREGEGKGLVADLLQTQQRALQKEMNEIMDLLLAQRQGGDSSPLATLHRLIAERRAPRAKAQKHQWKATPFRVGLPGSTLRQCTRCKIIDHVEPDGDLWKAFSDKTRPCEEMPEEASVMTLRLTMDGEDGWETIASIPPWSEHFNRDHLVNGIDAEMEWIHDLTYRIEAHRMVRVALSKLRENHSRKRQDHPGWPAPPESQK
jgi:hypothetical protein